MNKSLILLSGLILFLALSLTSFNKTTGSQPTPQAIFQLPTSTPVITQEMLLESVEAAFAKHLANTELHGKTIFTSLRVEDHWAFGIAETEGDDSFASRPIYLLAHQLPDQTWNTVTPEDGKLFAQWFDSVPENLIPEKEKTNIKLAILGDNITSPVPFPIEALLTENGAKNGQFQTLSTFSNPDGDYSFKYPSNWSIKKEKYWDDINLISFDSYLEITTIDGESITLRTWKNIQDFDSSIIVSTFLEPFLNQGSTRIEDGFIRGNHLTIAIEPGLFKQSPPSIFALFKCSDTLFRFQYIEYSGGISIEAFRDLLTSFICKDQQETDTGDELTNIPKIPNSELYEWRDSPEGQSCLASNGITYWDPNNNQFTCGQCTWWANYSRPDIPSSYAEWNGDAWEWYNNALETPGFSVSDTPEVGAIAVWEQNQDGAGPAGHVAYVTGVNSNGTFNVSEMNWGTPNQLSERPNIEDTTHIKFILAGVTFFENSYFGGEWIRIREFDPDLTDWPYGISSIFIPVGWDSIYYRYTSYNPSAYRQRYGYSGLSSLESSFWDLSLDYYSDGTLMNDNVRSAKVSNNSCIAPPGFAQELLSEIDAMTCSEPPPPGNDTTPPSATGFFVSVSGGIATLTTSGVSDNSGGSGVREVRFSAYFNGSWQGIGTDYTAPFSLIWDMCSWNVPDGDIELGMEVWDNANNVWIWSQHYPNPHITKSYQCGGGSGDVVLCTSDNASSGCWIFPTGIYPNLSDFGLNDQMRSVLVPGGKSVLLFREGGFKGTAECYSGDRIPLPIGDPWDLRGQVTGVHVFDQSNCPTGSLFSVIMYDNANYGSHYWGMGYDPGLININGIYGGADQFFNDHAESIRIPPGWSAKLYEHANAEGSSSSCLMGDVSYLGGFNNIASSVDIFREPNCPSYAPAMPSNLTVSDVTPNSVSLSWQDNSNNEDGFKIYRWGWNGTNWDFIQIATVGPNSTSYVNNNLECATNYYYTVSSYGGGGDSPQTDWVVGFTDACMHVKVLNAWTADGNWGPKTTFNPGESIQWVIDVENTTGADANILLTWDVRGPGGESIFYWVGFVTTGNGIWSWYFTQTVPSGLGGSHSFTGAVTHQGNYTQDNTTYFVTGPYVPNAPSNLIISDTTQTSVTLSWQDNSNNETGFNIYHWNGTIFAYLASVGANVTTFTHTGLACNNYYYYEVSAYNNGGESQHTPYVFGLTDPCTPTPTITSTNSLTPTPTKTSTSTQTNTLTPTATATKTNTPTSTATFTPTNTSTPTTTSTSTYTPSPTFTPTITSTSTSTFTPAPPPSNDDFDNSVTIFTLPHNNIQDVTSATTASDDPTFTCVAGQGYYTVWYRYTPASNQSIVIDTFGSSYDTILAVWTGSRGSLQSQACNDDFIPGENYQSQVILPLTAGIPYYVEVAGYSSTGSGLMELAVDRKIFSDVSLDHWARAWIHAIYYNGITSGCGGGNYCPSNAVTRAQMSVFLLKAKHGSAYTPPPATGTMFQDVPISHWAAAWIEELAREGITSGCGEGNYCPEQPVTRAQMAVFLLRAKYGSSYTPPPATGTMFLDVPLTHWAAAWIEQLAHEEITSGCGGGNYCPDQSVTRAQMAVFLTKTFNIPVNGAPIFFEIISPNPDKP